MTHITDIVASMALAWPQIQFRLTHNQRIVKSWAAAEPFDRVADVLGGSLRGDLHPVAPGEGPVAVTGWVGSPRVNRRSSSGIFIFVNNRLVRDRLIQHALFQGYSQRLVKGQFPLAALFVTLPFDAVDVNVHPAKNEVRFARSQEVHEAVRRAVAQALYDADRPRWKLGVRSGRARRGRGRCGGEGGIRKGEGGRRRRNSEGGRRRAEGGIRRDRCGKTESGGPHLKGEHGAKMRARPWTVIIGAGRPSHRACTRSRESRGVPSSSGTAHPASRHVLQTVIWEKEGFAGLRVIGQLHDTYIVCEAPDGLVLIDQHAAHERVLYEQLSRRENAPAAAQTLLVPETVELSHREAGCLEGLAPALAELGILIEPFGGNTVVVKAVPPALSGRPIQPLLAEIAAAAADSGGAANPQAALDRFRQIAACHGAIRAHQSLAPPQIERLLAQLDRCVNPAHCPHGRPTWLRYDTAVLERAFKRVV